MDDDNDGVTVEGTVVNYDSAAVARVLARDAATRIGHFGEFSFSSTHHGHDGSVVMRIKKKAP